MRAGIKRIAAVKRHAARLEEFEKMFDTLPEPADTHERETEAMIRDTLVIVGPALCLQAYRQYETSGEGANTIASGMESAIVKCLADIDHHTLRPRPRPGARDWREELRRRAECHLSHQGLTHWGDRLIDAGRFYSIVFEDVPVAGAQR